MEHTTIKFTLSAWFVRENDYDWKLHMEKKNWNTLYKLRRLLKQFI